MTNRKAIDVLEKGTVVLMKASSGLKGYGNYQCVSWYSPEIGELSLYGHNEHYHDYDVEKIIETPDFVQTRQSVLDEVEAKLPKKLKHEYECEVTKDTCVCGVWEYNTLIDTVKSLLKDMKNERTL